MTQEEFPLVVATMKKGGTIIFFNDGLINNHQINNISSHFMTMVQIYLSQLCTVFYDLSHSFLYDIITTFYVKLQ